MQLVNRMFARTRIVVLLLAGFVPLDGARAAEDVPVIEAPGVQAPAAPATFAGGPVSPGLMAAIRAGTFEVVLRKTETDPLAYEKPLPMELLPFAVRNDAYKSIGTAFAIAPGTFVTAAHVFTAASGSQLGVPALRDAKGKVYPVDLVTQFSPDKDFLVFTVSGAPQVEPLPTSTTIQVDTPVIAVGNALGQGIVARDGTLTSETPEEQDGAWNWLRFSAPASPGNSGGPLLDSNGRVLGVIARKSANENLNFALPIALVLQAPANKAIIDVRMTVGLPFITMRKTVDFETGFDLPLRFEEFDRKLLALNDERYAAAQKALLEESASQIFPRGNSSRLLSDTFLTSNPSMISQQPDGSWDVPRTNAGGNTQLGNDGYVWMGSQPGVALFRIRYPSELDVTASRADSKLLSEQLLRGIRVGRPFGAENVRITSLGHAGKPREFTDVHGRHWQQWFYPLPFADTTMVVTVLPVPDGYVGTWRSAGGSLVERTAAEVRLIADFMQVSYGGTLPQWRGFLADAKLRPQGFGQWKFALDPAGEISLQTPRFSLSVNREVLALTDQSTMAVFPGMLLAGDQPVWDVLALQLSLEPRLSPGISAVRRARPAPDAGQIPNARWRDMIDEKAPFNGSPVRNQGRGFARRAVGAQGAPRAEAGFLYDLSYITTTQVQGEVQRAMPRVLEMFKVLEN